MKANKQATTANLIAQLNPVIRGWANYHRHVVSQTTFYQVDTAIFKSLWSWAKRRHPKKPRRWVADKYFQPRNGGMPGNWHVSFLGGWAGVISSGYPVGGSDDTSLPDPIGFNHGLRWRSLKMTRKTSLNDRFMPLRVYLVSIGFLLGIVAPELQANTEVIPPEPASHDLITVRFSGEWPNSCVPRHPQITFSDNEIQIYTFQFVGLCLDVITPWTLDVSLGLLPVGTYDVTATHIYLPQDRDPLVLGQIEFTVINRVGGLVTRMSPGHIICWNLTSGQLITIAQPFASWNCEEAGLLVEPGDQIYTGVTATVD